MKLKIKKTASLFVLTCITSLTIGCKKWIAVDPPIQSITAEDVYKTNTTAAAVLTGIYIDMSNFSVFTGLQSVSLYTGVYSDELIPVTEPTDILSLFYKNQLTNNDGGFWGSLYSYIFRVNSAIEGLNASKTLSSSVKQQLIGEAKFLRAYYYFYLVNLYGDVPLLTSTNILVNSTQARNSVNDVYLQMIQDLKESQQMLSDEYLSSDVSSITQQRTRPNRAVATALLARVLLYTKQWADAELQANSLIEQTGRFKLEDLSQTFLAASREAIWQLQPVDKSNKNTKDGAMFILSGISGVSGPSATNGRPVYLSKSLFNSFNLNDKRKLVWIDSVTIGSTTYPYASKYKVAQPGAPNSEFLVMFRLAEVYLIRAEARAEQNRISGPNSAAEDINKIRARAGLQSISLTAKDEALEAIFTERRFELFTEHGQRWFDIKRSGSVSGLMTSIAALKNTSWNINKSLLPIPISEFVRNPNMRGSQNPGYPEQ